MSRVSSRIGRVELEALAQVDHRHRAAVVGDHALEELGRLGQRRGRHVAEDPLDLQDVERELLGARPGRSPPGRRRRCSCGRRLREACAQRGEIEQRHQTRPSVRATAAAQGSVAARGNRQCRRSYSTDSASSTSRQSRRPASSTSDAGRRSRSGGQAAPSSSAPRWTSGRMRPRTMATPRTAGSRDGTGKAGPGIEHLDHLVQRQADPPRAGADQQMPRRTPAHRAASGPARRRPAPAIRPTGRTWLRAAGLHAPRWACRRSWRSPGPARSRCRRRRGSRAARRRRRARGR